VGAAANGTVAIVANQVVYTPNADFNGADSFTYTVTSGAVTETATVNVTVTAVNDAPVLGNNPFTITKGATQTIGNGTLSATDVDNAAGTLVFTIGSIANGHFELVSSPGAPIGSFTQQQILNGEVRFVHDGPGVPSFSIFVSDGAAGVGPYTANIVFNPAGFVPPPPPRSSPPTDIPPVLVSMTPPVPTGLPNPIAQDFLRSPASAPEEGGEDDPGVAEPTPPVTRASSRAVEGRVIVPETQFLPVRTEPEELETTPIRAEMHVIPTRHGLDPDDEEKQRIEVIMSSVRITGLALSVGAVWWAARAAGLIASLLASAPAWRHRDPLPVLGRDEEEEKESEAVEEDQDEKDEEHRARWVLEGPSTMGGR